MIRGGPADDAFAGEVTAEAARPDPDGRTQPTCIANPYGYPSFGALVLGCLEDNFLQPTVHVEAFFEICKIRTRVHRSKVRNCGAMDHHEG